MNWFINSYAWVIFVFLHFFFISVLSFKANSTAQWKYSIYAYLLSTMPWWTLIARYSKSLSLAGFAYDLIVTLSWTICVVLYENKSFSIQNYFGLFLIICGMIIFKRG